MQFISRKKSLLGLRGHSNTMEYIKINTVRIICKSLLYVALLGLSFIFIYPFLKMITTSMKSPGDLVNITVQWIPRGVYWYNFISAANALDYFKGLKNSMIVTTLCITGHAISCSFIGYGFARYKFPTKELLFSIVILTIIVPVQTIIIPLYIQYSKVGFLNTYIPIILPTFFGFGLRGGLFIFIFRQFYLGLPYELEESAKIDGCSALKTYSKIILPLSGQAMLVSIILSMVWHWNDYFEPNIYLAGANWLKLITDRLPYMYDYLTNQIINEELVNLYNEAVILAGTFLVILPIMIVYLILQKRFIEGLERTGLKG